MSYQKKSRCHRATSFACTLGRACASDVDNFTACWRMWGLKAKRLTHSAVGGEEDVEAARGGHEDIEDLDEEDGDIGGDVLEPLLGALVEYVGDCVGEGLTDLRAEVGVLFDGARHHLEEAHTGLDDGSFRQRKKTKRLRVVLNRLGWHVRV